MPEDAPVHHNDLDPHFSNPWQWIFTLDPLRELGVDALDICGLAGILFRPPTLRELEIHFNNSRHDIIIRKSDNLFGPHGAGAGFNPIPSTGTLVRASFDLFFRGEARPRILHLRPPRQIELLPSRDLRLLWPWLRTFRVCETIAKTLMILGVAGTVAFGSAVDAYLDDDDTHHRWSFMVRR